jgi:hypothetical protein
MPCDADVSRKKLCLIGAPITPFYSSFFVSSLFLHLYAINFIVFLSFVKSLPSLSLSIPSSLSLLIPPSSLLLLLPLLWRLDCPILRSLQSPRSFQDSENPHSSILKILPIFSLQIPLHRAHSPCKTRSELLFALSHGVHVNCNSLGELEKIKGVVSSLVKEGKCFQCCVTQTNFTRHL